MRNVIIIEEFEAEARLDKEYDDLNLDGESVYVAVAQGVTGGVELGKKYRVTVTVEEVDA